MRHPIPQRLPYGHTNGRRPSAQWCSADSPSREDEPPSVTEVRGGNPAGRIEHHDEVVQPGRTAEPIPDIHLIDERGPVSSIWGAEQRQHLLPGHAYQEAAVVQVADHRPADFSIALEPLRRLERSPSYGSSRQGHQGQDSEQRREYAERGGADHLPHKTLTLGRAAVSFPIRGGVSGQPAGSRTRPS